MELRDIPIGRSGESRKPTIEALKLLGINVNPSLIPSLRTGLTSGLIIGDILTPFDQLVISSYLDKKTPVETALQVRRLTGINYSNDHVLPIHRDALVYGRLGHPYRSQKP